MQVSASPVLALQRQLSRCQAPVPPETFVQKTRIVLVRCGFVLRRAPSHIFFWQARSSGKKADALWVRSQWGKYSTGLYLRTTERPPRIVVIIFLVQVAPLAAVVTALITIYNNALAFSIYSFFLPKDVKGQYIMPASLTKAGGEVLVAGSGIAMIVGVIMLVLRAATLFLVHGPAHDGIGRAWAVLGIAGTSRGG